MAYYIDEVKKTAVKAEGKAIYGWNHESRRFDLPVADATPKSRMSRCSEFEARRYLFEQDPRDCYERIAALANKIEQMPEHGDIDRITVEQAVAELNAAEVFKEEVRSEIRDLQAAVDEYGMGMSTAGKLLANSVLLLESKVKVARNAIEIARCNAEIEKCEKGQCGECPYAKACDKTCSFCPIDREKGLL